MFKIKCDKCGHELEVPGGLAFSPPVMEMSKKFHLCVRCWDKFVTWIRPEENPFPELDEMFKNISKYHEEGTVLSPEEISSLLKGAEDACETTPSRQNNNISQEELDTMLKSHGGMPL